ncbi:tetratricopeptide repeat protein [Rubinisphaera margarita]|uniref:tetratricopeptide repeat protein n=1 Tax=Rubinisphaera margarita TaxID=2909586 RepID=UPI001EE883BE|nr:tetratricopeptide repeat protein [Rubinisphaera margarita]
MLDSTPDDNVGYLLGTLLLQKGDAAQAVEHLQPIVERHPEIADLHNNLGVAYQSLGKRQEAVKAFQGALKANQDYPQAWQNLGKLLWEMNYRREAEKCYREAVRLLPDDLQCRQDWMQSLVSTEQWNEAAREIGQLLETGTLSAETQIEWKTQLAYVAAQQHDYVQAITLSEDVLACQPDNMALLSNLSFLYEHVGRIEDAIRAAEQAHQQAPKSAEILNNLGIAQRSAHRCDEAIDSFSKAIALNPELTLAAFNRGSTLLLTERYQEGWTDYENRLRLIPQQDDLQQLPLWDGEPIPGKKLLIACDQGYGDILMFARFLPLIRERSEAVTIFRVPAEMLRLFNGSRVNGLPLADRFLSEDDPLPQADFQFPLMSSGARFSLSIDEIGMAAPYLQAPASMSQPAGNAGQSTGADRKIGLCWRGNAAQAQDHVRSLALETLLPLAEISGVEWVSLQIDATGDELSGWPASMQTSSPPLTNFAETAALLDQLDLIITVDTAVAHLAGAMGRPTWALLPWLPDWRWHLNRSDSPWYPSMRLYRQPAWGDWSRVIADLRNDLTSTS